MIKNLTGKTIPKKYHVAIKEAWFEHEPDSYWAYLNSGYNWVDGMTSLNGETWEEFLRALSEVEKIERR